MHDQPAPDSAGPTILRMLIIGLTVIGILFTFCAVVYHATRSRSPEQDGDRDRGAAQPSTDKGRSGAPGDKSEAGQRREKLPTEPAPPSAGPISVVSSPSAIPSSPSPIEETNGTAPEDAAPGYLPVRQTSAEEIAVRNRNEEKEVDRIVREHEALLARPDTSVYRRIAANLRQMVQVQMVIVKSRRGETHDRADTTDASTRLAMAEQFEDPPYYTGSIARYSRLLAKTVCELSGVLGTSQDGTGQKQLLAHLATTRETPVEEACDSAIVAARGLTLLGKEEARRSPRGVDFEDIDGAIRNAAESRDHIVRKTEMAHQVMRTAMVRCIKVWDTQKKAGQQADQIERQCKDVLPTAPDYYHRLAMSTDAEVRLTVLLLQTITTRTQ